MHKLQYSCKLEFMYNIDIFEEFLYFYIFIEGGERVLLSIPNPWLVRTTIIFTLEGPHSLSSRNESKRACGRVSIKTRENLCRNRLNSFIWVFDEFGLIKLAMITIGLL